MKQKNPTQSSKHHNAGNRIEQKRIEWNKIDQNEQNRIEQTRLEQKIQNRIEQKRIEQNRTEQSRKYRIEENRIKQNRIGQDRTEQSRSGYNKLEGVTKIKIECDLLVLCALLDFLPQLLFHFLSICLNISHFRSTGKEKFKR